jgi:hypothetical protein
MSIPFDISIVNIDKYFLPFDICLNPRANINVSEKLQPRQGQKVFIYIYYRDIKGNAH